MIIAPTVNGDLLGPINGVVFNVTAIALIHLVVRRLTPPPRRLPPPL
jgi:hypothetical protein